MKLFQILSLIGRTDRDLNPNQLFWRQLCYHYTISLYWWTVRDLNPKPSVYETDALTYCANGPYGASGWYRTNILGFFRPALRPHKLQRHMVAHLGTAPSEPIDKSFTDSTASLTGYCAILVCPVRFELTRILCSLRRRVP